MRDNYVSSIGQLYKKVQTTASDAIELEAKSIYELAKFYIETREKLPIRVSITETDVHFEYDKDSAEKLTKILKDKYGIITDGMIYMNPHNSSTSVYIVDFV